GGEPGPGRVRSWGLTRVCRSPRAGFPLLESGAKNGPRSRGRRAEGVPADLYMVLTVSPARPCKFRVQMSTCRDDRQGTPEKTGRSGTAREIGVKRNGGGNRNEEAEEGECFVDAGTRSRCGSRASRARERFSGRAAGDFLGRTAPGADVVRRSHRPSGLLPGGVRPPAPLAR